MRSVSSAMRTCARVPWSATAAPGDPRLPLFWTPGRARAQTARMQRCRASYRDASSLEASWHEAAADEANLPSVQQGAYARAAAQESCVRARAGGTPACATPATCASARLPGGASPSATPWRSWRSCMPPCAAASLKVRHTNISAPSLKAQDMPILCPFAPVLPSPLTIITPEDA